MAQMWITSDQHFDHDAMVYTLTNADGSPARVFESVDAMNERMVEEWNAVVRPQDHVYCLGDIALKRSGLRFVARLHGHKRLVRGNHDLYKTKDYLNAGFEEIHGARVLDGSKILLTHFPVHPSTLAHRFAGNAHGHTHHAVVAGRYVNVCVERTNYRPVHVDDVVALLKARRAEEVAAALAACQDLIARRNQVEHDLMLGEPL